MVVLSKAYTDKLNTCHPKLVELILALAEKIPICIACGVRDKQYQDMAFASGNSKLKFPESFHNLKPGRNAIYSLAVDIAPLVGNKINWNDVPSFMTMLKLLEDIAKEKNIKIKLGRDFSWVDLPHVQLDGEEYVN